MANCQNDCQNPRELKTRPEECTPARIEKCHGQLKDHPCVAPEDKE